MGPLDGWKSSETLDEPPAIESAAGKGVELRENLDLKSRVLAIFDTRDNIPEVMMERMLGEIPVSGTVNEIKQQVDSAVTALQDEGIIKFDPETREFSKVKSEPSQAETVNKN